MAWYSSYGSIGDILNQWEQAGFFSYLLPFLLIFALVFGILEKTRIFKDNKSVNGIIGLVVGLMALQFGVVSRFFSEIFPRLGIGLAVLLIVMILGGLFLSPENWSNYILLGIAGIILAIVLVQTAGAVGWASGYWWQDNWPVVAGVVLIIILMAVIVGNSSDDKTFKPSKYLADMFGLKPK